jgi:hypothetical protein
MLVLIHVRGCAGIEERSSYRHTGVSEGVYVLSLTRNVIYR